MSTFFMILTGIFMATTLGTLMVGIFGMSAGGEFNKRHGNRLMRLRVIFQGCAILSFALFILTRG